MKEIGNSFIIGIPGTEADQTTLSIIKEYGIGGVILFSKNIETPEQVAELCKNLQNASLKYQDSPLLIAIDQEGGRVSRLKPPFFQSAGNWYISCAKDPVKEARDFSQKTAYEMKLVGINMNLAPVLDVCYPCAEFLRDRTFGSDPKTAALLGQVIIEEMNKNGIISTAKHFPGLGPCKIDPHKEVPVVDIDWDKLERIHIYPFKKAIACGVPAIMVSHGIYRCIDPLFPASVSYKVIRLLRNTLRFDGLIITDDMEMGAIKHRFDLAEACVMSIKAGVDIVLVCRDQTIVIKAIEMLKQALKEKEISKEDLLCSYKRIHKIKKRFSLEQIDISVVRVKEYFKRRK